MNYLSAENVQKGVNFIHINIQSQAFMIMYVFIITYIVF